MPAQDPPQNLLDALLLLREMMKGRRLTVAEAVALVKPRAKRAAVSRWLKGLADHLPHGRREGRSPEVFWWEWPSAEASEPETVWSLAAARTMLHGFEDSVIGATLRNLVEEHRSRLSPASTGRVPADPSRMFFANTTLVQPLGLAPDMVDKIAKAIFECEVITFRYVNFEGDRFGCRVEPWSMMFSDSGVYLFARCLDSDRDSHVGHERLYNLARLSQVRTTREHFAYPNVDDFRPREQFRHSFGIFLPPDPAHKPAEVRLRFTEVWREYLERHKLHREQDDPVPADDGRVEVVLHLHVTYDLVRWVRGHGREVEVIGPPLLKDWVQSGEGGDFYKTYDGEG